MVASSAITICGPIDPETLNSVWNSGGTGLNTGIQPEIWLCEVSGKSTWTLEFWGMLIRTPKEAEAAAEIALSIAAIPTRRTGPKSARPSMLKPPGSGTVTRLTFSSIPLVNLPLTFRETTAVAATLLGVSLTDPVSNGSILTWKSRDPAVLHWEQSNSRVTPSSVVLRMG
jgi:hypothetical protein